ncbi:uncharacterized protein LOC118439181 [Folsomia candida]|uniref:Phospholipid-metabolizing enzyme A-C1 n=1 Tax=Folsomia candida TaxID=158441 RepID=A0A226D7N9_FOLCA|nr:uncharacterized protein LOC118439181 [Folsomia candida]OXA40888.1 Phospholipid-metabolizing enzyme A-C1 [Folsomia candida]
MYLGEGKVSNVVFSKTKMTGVLRLELLHKAVSDGRKIRVNNLNGPAKERGLTVLAGGEIWKLIQQDLADLATTNSDGSMTAFVPYHLTLANCEHYVTKWRYGEGFSLQTNALETKRIGEIVHKVGLAIYTSS